MRAEVLLWTELTKYYCKFHKTPVCVDTYKKGLTAFISMHSQCCISLPHLIKVVGIGMYIMLLTISFITTS